MIAQAAVFTLVSSMGEAAKQLLLACLLVVCDRENLLRLRALRCVRGRRYFRQLADELLFLVRERAAEMV